MLKGGGLVLVVVVVLALVVIVATRGSPSPTASTHTTASESTTEGESEIPLEGAREREIEIAHDHELEQTRPRVERLAEIRDEVHVLEMQRLDAHARHDVETEARLDAEITALRARNDRLRGVGQPEGI